MSPPFLDHPLSRSLDRPMNVYGLWMCMACAWLQNEKLTKYCGVLSHILGFWATFWGSGPHCGVLGHILGFWATLWGSGPHCGVLGHILGFWATLWGSGPHCGVLGHILGKMWWRFQTRHKSHAGPEPLFTIPLSIILAHCIGMHADQQDKFPLSSRSASALMKGLPLAFPVLYCVVELSYWRVILTSALASTCQDRKDRHFQSYMSYATHIKGIDDYFISCYQMDNTQSFCSRETPHSYLAFQARLWLWACKSQWNYIYIYIKHAQSRRCRVIKDMVYSMICSI